MLPQEIENPASVNPPLIIVGNGPVGIKLANLILAKDPQAKIVIFGEEKSKPYNRVQLSLFLAGKIGQSELDNPIDPNESHRVKEYIGRKIVSIDRDKKLIRDNTDCDYHYSKLILAVGAKPAIPKLENIELNGVFQFRTIEDTTDLLNSKKHCKHFHIVGVGPLGLETAFALKQPDNNITLHVREQLLTSGLNAEAQLVLSDYIEASGIKISLHNPIKNIIGIERIEAIELETGDRVPCDCLIFCAGIVPNIWLAQMVGLTTLRGIIVDEFSLTSDPNIYAVGECTEHQNKTYGTVYPGFKQAKSCVEHLYGKQLRFQTQKTHIQVKFGNYTTAYYGELEVENGDYYSYSNRLKGIYRKLIFVQHKIVGAIIVGNWNEENEISFAITKKRKFSASALKSFEVNGVLINETKTQNPKDLPEDYLICLCEEVSRGELSLAIESGNRTIEMLGMVTKAGTVCGSCKPMLAGLLDVPVANLVMRHKDAFFRASILSIALILLTLFLEPTSLSKSVQSGWSVEKLWLDSFWKQISGYSLLTLCLFATALSLRKRTQAFNFGHLDSWRYAHSIIGVIALFVLMLHTGMRLGDNLNFALMMVFLAATMTGSLVGIFMARNHQWSDLKLRAYRLWWSRVHHTLLWMLPPLIGFHIFSAYYF